MHWPRHYRAVTIATLVQAYKIKWLDDHTIRVLSPTPIIISSPDLEDLIEAPHLWPDHQRIVDQILTIASRPS